MAQVAIRTTQFQENLSEALLKDDTDGNILVGAYRVAEACAKKNTLLNDHILDFDPDFFGHVEKGIADLKDVDRPILVVGESSAGKSSFLNLLMGRKILPALASPCTHCICCIRKGKTLEAHVSSVDGSTPRDVISGDGMTDDQFCDKLQELVDNEDCTKVLNRCIDIFVPNDILQDSVYLVDTPGFGESVQITKVLLQFLPKAIGIIFILNATVCCGIADDRGALILDEIKKLKTNGVIPLFDPRNIVFIANKWDQISEKERKRHLEKTVKRMETFWPEFQENQLFTLSVLMLQEEGHQKWNPDGFSCAKIDFQNVLDKIEEIIHRCAYARSTKDRRYLGKFLQYLKTCVDAVENFSELSSKSKKTKAVLLHTLIADLESACEQGQGVIKSFGKAKTSIANGVHQHLNTKKDTIFKWQDKDIPNGNKYSDVKRRAHIAIRKFIVEAIDDYVEKWMSKSQNLIDPLSELTLKIAEKEARMKRCFCSTEIENVSAKEIVPVPLTPDSENLTDMLSKKEIATLVVTSPLWIPLGIAGAITALPVGLAIQKGRELKHMSDYNDNRIEYLNQWTEKILQNEFTLDNLESIIFGMLTRKVDEKMRYFSESIRKFQKILTHLDPKKKSKDVVRHYAEMRELCSHLDHLLTELDKPLKRVGSCQPSRLARTNCTKKRPQDRTRYE